MSNAIVKEVPNEHQRKFMVEMFMNIGKEMQKHRDVSAKNKKFRSFFKGQLKIANAKMEKYLKSKVEISSKDFAQVLSQFESANSYPIRIETPKEELKAIKKKKVKKVNFFKR